MRDAPSVASDADAARIGRTAGRTSAALTRTLHLLRHAKSSWADPSLPDHERPLAKRGRRDAARLADHLRRLAVAPELVLCSSALRARETLELVAPGFASPPAIRIDAALYAAPAAALLEVVRGVPDEVRAVMLIGHNPGIADLALLLDSGGPERQRLEEAFPTGGLATLTTSAASWMALSLSDAWLTAFVTPRQLA